MIALTAEMRAAAARRMGVDDLDPWTVAALVDVLALVERDYVVTPRPAEQCGSRGFAGGSGCWLEKGHDGDHRWSRTVKVKWVCRKCGGPLNQCETCKEPAQCGEAWCADHEPVKHALLGDVLWNPANAEYDAECSCGEMFSGWIREAAEERLLIHIGRQS